MEQQLSSTIPAIAAAVRASTPHDPVAAAEQIAILLYLKLLDAEDGPPASSRERRSPAIFASQAERYRWRHWHHLPAADLVAFLTKEVLPYMGSLEKEEPAIAGFFRDAELSSKDQEATRRAVLEIDAIPLAQLDPATAGDLLEGLLAAVGWREVDGMYGTSPVLRNLLVRLADPRPGETVLDPAMGAAGLLADAARHAQEEGGAAPRLLGLEVSRTMLRIATVNMALRGLPTEGLRRQDALSDREGNLGGPTSGGVDVVLCDPPFGPRRLDEGVGATGSMRSRRLEALFLDIAMRALTEGGRAAIVVPDGVLFDPGPAHVELRRALVEEFDLLCVLSMTPGRFRAQTLLRSSVLVFGRPSPSYGPRPKRIWFHQLAGGTRRRGRPDGPEDRTGLSDFLRNWERHRERGFMDPPGLPAEAILDSGSRQPRSWWAERDVIADSGYRLDAQRWAPVVSDWPLDDDPAELAATASRDYRKLAEEIEALATAIGS